MSGRGSLSKNFDRAELTVLFRAGQNLASAENRGGRENVRKNSHMMSSPSNVQNATTASAGESKNSRAPPIATSGTKRMSSGNLIAS